MAEPTRGPGRIKRVGTPAPRRRASEHTAPPQPVSRHPLRFWFQSVLSFAAANFAGRYWWFGQPPGESLALTVIPAVTVLSIVSGWYLFQQLRERRG